MCGYLILICIHLFKLIFTRHEIIWNNIFITIDNKPFFFDSWKNAGIVIINDLLDSAGNFMSHTEVTKKYNVKCNFLSLIQIRHSIPLHWRNMITRSDPKCKPIDTNFIQIDQSLCNIDKFTCKLFYWILVSKKYRKPTCTVKWIEQFPLFNNVNESIWHRIFSMPFTVTRETKLQSFQYRLVHRIIPCNKWLYDITIRDSSLCSFCKEEDSLTHFFIHCKITKAFWISFFHWWHRTSGIDIQNTLDEHILFGYPGNNDVEDVLNYCMLFGKYYIYCKKTIW